MSTLEDIQLGFDDEDLSDEDNYEENSSTEHDENSDNEIFKGPSNTMPFNKTARDQLRQIYDLLEMRQEVNYKNALEMNQEMLKRLQEIRDEINILKAKVDARYAANEVFLKKSVKTKSRTTDGVFGKISRGEKFYIKGSIYFKDIHKRNAPNNDDYRERQKNGEMFPMDFELTSRHVWSITDKISIIKGIKEQIYEDKALRKRFKNKNQKLGTMLKEIETTFQIDWVQISVHNLRHRHTPTSCKAMFEVYLHPTLKHDAFTEDENERLAQAAEKFNLQNWAAIAAEVGQRSDYQCFLHYHTTPSFRAPYERWDKRADDLLLKMVEASKCNGVINWSQISYLFPHKSRTSLQQRYHYFLNPAISHAPFSGEEDLLLLAAVQEYGANFAKFPRSLFPNRTVIQLRSRYLNTLATRHKACSWTIEDDRILLKFVEEHGMAWKRCSEFMEQRHTRTSCRQRYMVIQKHKEKNPDFKLEELPRRPFRMMSSCVTPDNWLHKIEELRANPELSIEETTKAVKRSRPRKRPMVPAIEEPTPKRPKENRKPIYVERLRQCGMLYHNFFKYSYNFRFGKQTQYTPIELYTNESHKAIDSLGFHNPGKGDAMPLERRNHGSNINGLLMPERRRLNLAAAIKQRVGEGMVLEPNGDQLAPNFSTLIAMRALCVLSADTLRKREEIKTTTTSTVCKTKIKIEDQASEIKVKTEYDNEEDITTGGTASTSSFVLKKTLSTEEFNSVPAVNRFRQRFRALFYQAAGISRLPPSSIPIKNIDGNILTTHTIPSAKTALDAEESGLPTSMSEKLTQLRKVAPMDRSECLKVATTTSLLTKKIKTEREFDINDDSSFQNIVIKQEPYLENIT